MTLVKIVKNLTTSNVQIRDTGIVINVGEVYQIPEQDFAIWAQSVDAINAINNDLICINNGTEDLDKPTSIRFIEYSDRLDIQVDSNDVTKVAKILNFEGSVTVTDEGNGKATVNVITAEDDRVVGIECIRFGDCDITVRANYLLNHDICYILKPEEC